ncbi:partner of bursicon-like [Pecten maximus]|uniref:partner of bursicon-like n=1 Tax=Pecten maximus TaxID=6579 RepID=UPI001458E813|nr:partner of bursicon-like [Pecten maximus]
MAQMVYNSLATIMIFLLLRGGHSLVDNCETKEIEINIVRSLTVQFAGSPRNAVCVANVLVNECDGMCVSRVTPSVSQFPGFDKICKCCSETSLISREITLTECRDGHQILDGVHPTTFFSQPANCACQPCQN